MNFPCRYLVFLLMLFFQPILLKAQITLTPNADSVGRYDVFEITITHPQAYANNWEDVAVTAAFTGPQSITINGFFYDTNVWKVRFAPPAAGNWKYTITFKTPTDTYTANGNIRCVPSQTKGFLQRHPHNFYRLIHPDGELFNGMGFSDCMVDIDNDGIPINDWGIDGDFTNPPAAFYYGKRTTLENYMHTYGDKGAKFNMFRWTTDNCSYRLYNSITTTGNNYGINEGKWGDSLVVTLRKNKIRLYLVFFGPPVFNQINSGTPLEEAALKRYINYVVARYGAYADIWELFNENTASDYYINTITSYIRSIDPYKRLISVSDERPEMPTIDITSPHWYQKESELQSDIVAWDKINTYKKWNKPVIFGEQGNSGQNWDELSADRMRIRSWTAFFAEGMFVFWNTSTLKNYIHPSANIYLGPQERGYIHALQNFTALADSGVRQSPIFPKNTSEVRAYGLKSAKTIMGYFHHYASHVTQVNTTFQYRMRQNGMLYWINPADNEVIDSAKVYYGNQTITSPYFTTDLAMRIELDQTPITFDVHQKLDLIAYPNPTTGAFYIDGNFNGTALVELFDTSGRKALSRGNIAIGQQINTGGLAPGLYYYRVTVDERTATGKLVIL